VRVRRYLSVFLFSNGYNIDMPQNNIDTARNIALLVVDADREYSDGLESALKPHGVDVRSAADVDGARRELDAGDFNAVLMNIGMADERGLALIARYREQSPGGLFYLVLEADYGSVETSLDLSVIGVDDYIQKSVDAGGVGHARRFARTLEDALGRRKGKSTALLPVEPLVSRVKPYFLLRSPAMKRALSHLSEIAESDHTVLISGATGTGKELVARAVHLMSRRAAGPFVPVNCGAIPEGLIEGELFGHEKGAFTGALRTRRGKFESANGGTLFLDEIGDMPLSLQVRLLRVLEEGVIYRVGAESPIRVSVRVIAASLVELEKAVQDGLFREDLYYRLNVLRMDLPPLNERPEDVSLLAVHFLERAFTELGRAAPYPELSQETIYLLERHQWRGNVRQLRNIMTRVATLLPRTAQKVLPVHVLPHLEEGRTLCAAKSAGVFPGGGLLKTPGVVIPPGTSLEKAEELIIKSALKETAGNRTKAAKLLGIGIRTLRRKLNG
jgi:DNA-binding NtrC family response regulator